jgi:hypothetical protein
LRFSGLILENIFMVFWGSPCRETARNAIKKIEGERRQEKSFFFLQFVRPKVFDMGFSHKGFTGVFELILVEKRTKTP